MRAFVCTCGQPLFFDNTRCLACGAEVAYDPHTCHLTALDSA
ncbi:MAG: zinc-ribbon domain-containing protein, partial [Betaproteobacteria bacterium]